MRKKINHGTHAQETCENPKQIKYVNIKLTTNYISPGIFINKYMTPKLIVLHIKN